MNSQNKKLQAAGIFPRLGAWIIDTCLIFLYGCFVLPASIILICKIFGYAHAFPFIKTEIGIAAFLFLLVWISKFIYYALFHASVWQATPGKMLFGLKVTRQDGARLSFIHSVKRSVACFIGSLTFGLDYAEIQLGDRDMALHDEWVETIVIKRKSAHYNATPSRTPIA